MRLETDLDGLKHCVADEPDFLERLEEWTAAISNRNIHEEWEQRQALQEQEEETKKQKDREKLIMFWEKIINKPEEAFSSEQSSDTASTLWRSMKHDGDNSRSSGWSRQFIEKHFNKETADRLRLVLMNFWREDHPTFPSERPENERNRYLIRWQLGLAAIYAEAENPDWAKMINEDDARLSVRYALIELNGLPKWLEALADAHPDVVEQSLGSELSWELNQPPGIQNHSDVLQRISYAPEDIANLFIPRLLTWLADGYGADRCDDEVGLSRRLRQVAGLVSKHGNTHEKIRLRRWSLQSLQQQQPPELRLAWLSILMRMDPAEGIQRLEHEIEGVQPAQHSEAVEWFASLFGENQDAIELGDNRIDPQLLLRLLQMAYRHVRVDDDVV